MSSQYSTHLVFCFQNECQCMNTNFLLGYQECTPNSTGHLQHLLECGWLLFVMCIGCRLIFISNLNLSRTKLTGRESDSSTRPCSHTCKKFCCICDMTIHYDNTFQNLHVWTSQKLWALSHTKNVSEICYYDYLKRYVIQMQKQLTIYFTPHSTGRIWSTNYWKSQFTD